MRVVLLGSHNAALLSALTKVLVENQITVATEEDILAQEQARKPLYGADVLTYADLDVEIRSPREPFHGFHNFHNSQQALNRKQQSFKAKARR